MIGSGVQTMSSYEEAVLLLESCRVTGNWTLKSGKSSSIYYDVKSLLCDPKSQYVIRLAMYQTIRRYCDSLPYDMDAPDGIVAPEGVGSCMLLGMLSDSLDWPAMCIRKDGSVVRSGKLPKRVIIIDDVLTAGTTLAPVIDKMDELGIEVDHIVVCVERAGPKLRQVSSQVIAPLYEAPE